MKRDIENRADIELLVNTFYDRVKSNALLEPIFNDVAQIDWNAHLPIMYTFWASILLNERSFFGNPMQKHIALSRLTTLTETEFSEWLALFTQTVDALFEGEKAEDAKARAANIARLMLHKIQTV